MPQETKELITRIKEAEENAAAIIKEAKYQAQKIIIDAKLDSKEMLLGAEADANARAHLILQESKTTVEADLEQVSKNTQKEKRQLEEKANKNLPKAINLIVDNLLKLYGHSAT